MLASTSFNIILNGSAWLYFTLAFTFIGTSFFIYQYTLPRVSTIIKYLLAIIRALIFTILLLLIFEPVLSLIFESDNKKGIFIFIDDSNSLADKDSLQRIEQIKRFIKDINSETNLRKNFFLIGNRIDSISPANYNLTLNKPLTNFENIYKYITKNENLIKGAIILSDGIITSGNDPAFQFEKLPFPVFTIGIGDTSSRRDIKIFDIKNNQYVYAGKETTIELTILNTGYKKKSVPVSLFEENKLLSSQLVPLNESGMNKIVFNYIPQNIGEKKLRIEIQPADGETNTQNNSKTFFMNVLQSKMKMTIIAGAPSPDVAAISNALENDKDIQLIKNIEVTQGKIWDYTKTKEIDSSKVLFLIDFPSKSTDIQFYNHIADLIEHGKPFFISISNHTDFQKLKKLEKYLPVILKKDGNESNSVQAELNESEYTSDFSQFGNAQKVWNNFPPIDQLSNELVIKPESKTIVRSKMREMLLGNPLISIRSIANQKSFLLNGWNYWRWGLQSAEKNYDFFKSFVQEINKWLYVSTDKKQFKITTSKKVFNQGESIEFTGELFDKSFNPIDTAKITLQITHEDKKQELQFLPIGNGIYSASITPETTGDFVFSGNVKLSASQTINSHGRFTVINSLIEKYDTHMRIEYMKLLASNSNGAYFPIENYPELKQRLNVLSKRNKDKAIEIKEMGLKDNGFALVILLFLFALEWFLRKRSGMI